MIIIHNGSQLQINWTIFKGMSKSKEDFRRALLRVFLVRTDMVEQPPLDDMYPVFNEAEYADYVLHPSAETYADTLPMNIVSVENGTIKIEIPQSVMAQLPVGVYSLKAVWFKNKQLLHDATHVGVADKSYSIVQNKFAITDVLAEATNPEIDDPVLNVQSGIATYGYNGLDSYEEAVLNGETLLSRGLWIANLSEMNSRFNEIQLEWDNDDEEEPGLKQQVEAKITDVEARMVSVENQWDDVKDEVDEKMGEWSEAESQRESNETTRISNETTRQTNETTRQGNETARQSNEATRLSQESGRVSAESTRASNETTRISNESARQSQESTRQSNETTRQNQESEREIQAARDHSQASSDHSTAVSDHTTAQSDHTTAASDHTTAQSDHDSAVQSTAIQYAEGDDDTTAPTAGWQDTVPEVEAGKYLWSRTTFTYGDGTTKVVYGVSLMPTVTVTENSTNGGVDINLNGSALPNGNVAKQSDVSQLSQKVIYDVSAHNDGAVFESLQSLLSSANLSTLIPVSVRHGGMSICFVQSSDNKYVQYRLKADSWSTVVSDWQSENVDGQELTSDIQPCITSLGLNKIDVTLQSGKFYDVHCELQSNANSVYSDAIDISSLNAKKILIAYRASNVSSGARQCLITNSNNAILQYKAENAYSFIKNGVAFLFLEAETTILYLYISLHKDNTLLSVYEYKDILSVIDGMSTIITNINQSVNTLTGKVNVLNNIVLPLNAVIEPTLSTGHYYNSQYYVALGDDATSKYTATPIDISNYLGKILRISLTNARAGSGRYILVTDSSDVVLAYVSENTINTAGGVYELAIPANASRLYISFSGSVTAYSFTIEISFKQNTSYMVSTDGSDTNDGKSAPLATVNKALELGASMIVIDGGVYNQQINLSLAKYPELTICSKDYKNVLFKPANSTLVTSAESVDGKTKVKQASLASSPLGGFIFQDGIVDASTEIPSIERHPLQRGKQYRCSDTMIVKELADSTANAIAAIEAADDYRWYYDSSEHILYFSSPETVTSTNPICGNIGNALPLFSSTKKDLSLKLVGINCKYMYFNLINMCAPKVIDCHCANAYALGGFVWDNSVGAEFVRCEAERIHDSYTSTTNTGDGFNAHASLIGTSVIGTKRVSATLIDCWSHDNNDDGYSDHQYCECTIIGGLYEYNEKAGITPSYGSHCTCYNVLSRRNVNGFFYTGEASDDGVVGGYVCYNCIASNNTKDGRLVTGKAGFFLDHYTGICYNCKSLNNVHGYFAPSGTSLRLIDCGAFGNNSAKSGNGTFDIVNTSILT